MLRSLLSRAGGVAAGVAALTGACLSTSCGGGGESARQMALVEFLYVDRSLSPTAATGTTSLPRNAQLLLKFSEEVDPGSVTNQTIQIRSGTGLIPQGSFSVNGNQVRFDPTVTSQGQPNPFGFDPQVQYTVYIPSFADQLADHQIGVVQNRDADPNQTTFRTAFTTSAGYLRELIPPQVLDVFFEPAPELLTGNIPGNGRMAVVFSEAMDPGSFLQGPQTLPLTPSTTIDVRYDPLIQVNIDNFVAGTAIPGFFTNDPSATIFYFNPLFSFGNKKLVFYLQCLQGLRDLSGNQLVNPRFFGNFTCDGKGISTGKLLTEQFLNTIDMDGSATDAIWGTQTVGTLQGQAVTSRQAMVFGYREAGNNPNSGRGQYAAIVDPLMGAALNQFVPNINPPTNAGRRVLIAFHDYEVGAGGTVTAALWGPDSNATFAALYQSIYLRMGYQATASMNLATSFSGNYSGTPQVLYNGDYQVAQNANIGDTVGEPQFQHDFNPPYQENPGCQVGGWNAPLFSASGFYAWPAFTTNFDWNPGTATDDDAILLWDMSVPEGDTWQQQRGWFAVTFPCSGVLIGGYPQRRLYSTYEDDTANPVANLAAGILNPEPSIADTSFTITKVTSVAQSLFYTEPAHPSQAAGGNTFSDLTDYRPAVLQPAIQAGGATVEIFFQGADAVANDRRTINQAAPFTAFTKDINACDGMKCIRWQIRLTSNLQDGTVAKITRVQIPMVSL
jgi:hypothetical protein